MELLNESKFFSKTKAGLPLIRPSVVMETKHECIAQFIHRATFARKIAAITTSHLYSEGNDKSYGEIPPSPTSLPKYPAPSPNLTQCGPLTLGCLLRLYHMGMPWCCDRRK